MKADDAERLKELGAQRENARLKRIVADQLWRASHFLCKR